MNLSTLCKQPLRHQSPFCHNNFIAGVNIHHLFFLTFGQNYYYKLPVWVQCIWQIISQTYDTDLVFCSTGTTGSVTKSVEPTGRGLGYMSPSGSAGAKHTVGGQEIKSSKAKDLTKLHSFVVMPIYKNIMPN